ncbi:MAG: amidohydrolase family protein [candidate division Zixibacteria bacterium]|nr:amidohydrolase family protein [candidate division Zixibacteria bacterium]
MLPELERHIDQTPLMDTHEHLYMEDQWINGGPDVLQDLFENYVQADLVVAGATDADVQFLLDAKNPDLKARFERVRKAWEAVQHTGYGEAVRILAERIYGMHEITPEGLEAARETNLQLRKPGTRLGLLQRGANLDHVQVDNFVWACLPDLSGPDFFLYDLSWFAFCNGQVPCEQLAQETGIAVQTLSDLRAAMEKLFALYGPVAIAVKAQHAYTRTLCWEERTDAAASAALDRILRDPEHPETADQLCLGDWAWARGLELAIEYRLPFKIHTGYYAGHSRMAVDRIKGGNLCPLLSKYLDAKFVLMHIAYPYNDELVAIAKHYPNVWVDMCWAWSINPYASSDFVRRFLHAVPINKLFVFGGDTRWPASSVAYAIQARKWFTRALSAEVISGDLTEEQAMAVATRLMQTNQLECFDLEGTRAAIHAKINAA